MQDATLVLDMNCKKMELNSFISNTSSKRSISLKFDSLKRLKSNSNLYRINVEMQVFFGKISKIAHLLVA